MDGERCKRCTTLATSQWLGSSSIVCTHCRTSCRRFGNYQEWAVTSFPDCAEAWLLVGAAAYQLGDAAGCVAACDRAIMLDPNLEAAPTLWAEASPLFACVNVCRAMQAEAYGNMGIALQATGRIDLAVVYYQVRLMQIKLLGAQT
eukprot:scaffold57485_cov20-Tisochrysis_lutea.AAC.4